MDELTNRWKYLERFNTARDDWTCDIDIDSPFCTAQNEAEKCLYTIINKKEQKICNRRDGAV